MAKKSLLIFTMLVTITLFSQNRLSLLKLNDSIEYYIKYRNNQKAYQLIKEMSVINIENPNKKYLLDKNKYYYYFIVKNNDSCLLILNKIKSYYNKLNTKNLVNYYINQAYFNKSINQLDISVEYFIKALKLINKSTILEIQKKKITIYAGLSSLYSLIENKSKELFYLNKYLSESYKINDKERIGYAHNNLAVYYDKNNIPIKALKNFKKSLIYMKRPHVINNINQNIGSIYLNHYNNIDSASFYNKMAINKFTSKRTLAYIHKDLSIIAKRNKNYLKENKELLLALKNIKEDNFSEFELKLHNDLAKNYFHLGKYKIAYNYIINYNKLNDSIKKSSLIKKVEEIETKYQTEKKEKENIQLKQKNLLSETKRKKSQNLFYGTLIFLFLVGTTGFLFLKNSKKKRLLAEQQKELEKQKNLTLLKEQEIMAINAMIKGQEKERIRIAEDLHDNIGSVLATLKLHFENLKLNREKKHFNQDELYEKTENLIDETYLKVRSIAHAKNAGVIANKGLLVAIKIMAEKISDANKIDIHVLDFGLNKRLENNLEITIFRLIQELITNIIKHANATEATINISLFDENLNIIIEDNGKGFNYNNTMLKEGMGINSIKTRIKYLNGTFNVDSTIGKGTSIIMDIPVI
ncbi:sensor histidine kinase [Tenacibaculum ovolyticum]|uniref:sensor histidine kinase n=1 Tax=Tenacibaculum ovolyticum TaxID=104270 RepID=UPI003BAC2464